MKLDENFFNKMLRRADGDDEEPNDFDVYLMETSVMPLLLQGLDALSRHVDKIQHGDAIMDGNKAPFNPLVWLAQFLLRNHPSHVKDHRTPMYNQFAELASIERGRRCLLRRRHQLEEAWQARKDDTLKGPISLEDIPRLLKRLDKAWGLYGLFCDKLPKDFTGLLEEKEYEHEEDGVSFESFWTWFTEHVQNNDVLRETAFIDAARRREEEERLARMQEEEALNRERAMQEALEQRSVLQEQFETVSADMYINDEITRIMNKGAVIHGVEEKEGGPPLRGEHIALIFAMLQLWGCPVLEQQEDGSSPQPPLADDVWTGLALAAWSRWLEARGLDSGPPRVDSATIRRLIDKDAFEEYLEVAFPVGEQGDEGFRRTVEVKSLIEAGEDADGWQVDALDEETGQIVRLNIPEHQVNEVQRRLQNAGEPVLAHIDHARRNIQDLLPN